MKSINDHMDGHVARGEVVLFDPPRERHEGYVRRIWLHREVSEWLYAEVKTKKERRHRSDSRSFIKRFVVGEHFDDDDLLKSLDPPSPEGVYELRIVFNPHTRIFGCFLRPREFIATYVKTKAQLDVDGYAKWKEKSIKRVEGMFPGHKILVGVSRKSLL